jgi:hypothetical protein
MPNCATCKHNTYGGNPNIPNWVSCGHPVTLAKQPHPEPGDPFWVNWMTADALTSQIEDLPDECPTWEARDPAGAV